LPAESTTLPGYGGILSNAKYPPINSTNMEKMKDNIAAHLRPLIDMAFPLSKGVGK
jgi:hypothetical protein